jgi:UDP-N-acetylmuramoyl-L-alanyl-D-glutamate--2,6-diaminopimelate ligase
VPRSLARLAEEFALETRGPVEGIEVSGVSVDADDLLAGDLYVALSGPAADAAAVARAAEHGAVAALLDPRWVEHAAELELPLLLTSDPAGAVGDLAAWVYRTQEHPPLLFAVTGTNGKTSVVHLLDALLRQLGVTTGNSSTAESRAGDEEPEPGIAEPEAPQLHALLARMLENGVRAAAVEVSARALTARRVGALSFDVVGFTNLSEDQLVDYPDMEAYLAAKQSLFDPDRARRGVVDVDGEWGRRVADEARIPVTTLATTPGTGDWTVTIDHEDQLGTAFTLEGPGGSSIAATVPLVGRFMATNAALAIVMLVESGFDLEAVGHAVERDGGILVAIPGRAERVSGFGSPALYVDVGTTAEALRTTLAALRAVTPGRLIVVLGADEDARTEDVSAAAGGADVLVLTEPIPASRAASAARQTGGVELHEIPEPRQALRLAISLAEPGDSVLCAAPGQKHHQETSDVKHPYNVRDDARLALQEAGWSVAS